MAREQAGRLEAEVAESEAALSDLPADSLGDAVATAESLLARARGLGALVAEKRRNIDRSLAALADAGVVETLTAEAAKLRADLAGAEEESAALAPRSAELDAIEETLEERRAELDPAGDPPGPQGGVRCPSRAGDAGRADRPDRSRAVPAGRPAGSPSGAASPAWPRKRPPPASRSSTRRRSSPPWNRARQARETAGVASRRRPRTPGGHADGDVHRWTARADALEAALGDLRAGLAVGARRASTASSAPSST